MAYFELQLTFSNRSQFNCEECMNLLKIFVKNKLKNVRNINVFTFNFYEVCSFEKIEAKIAKFQQENCEKYTNIIEKCEKVFSEGIQLLIKDTIIEILLENLNN